MSTLTTVTDRVDGEVLTAAKYNTDHGVHETNATTLNSDKVEITNFNTRHGPTGVHSADEVRDDLTIQTTDAVRFRVVTADSMIVSGDAPTTPDVRALYQDSIAKAWLYGGHSGGVPIISGDVNVSSLTDTGTGAIGVNFAVAMSSVNYLSVAAGGESIHSRARIHATTSVELGTQGTDHADVDTTAQKILVLGSN